MTAGRNAFGLPLGEIVEHSGACPDCDASTRLVEESPRIFRLTIMHDDTCPTWRRARRHHTKEH